MVGRGKGEGGWEGQGEGMGVVCGGIAGECGSACKTTPWRWLRPGHDGQRGVYVVKERTQRVRAGEKEGGMR